MVAVGARLSLRCSSRWTASARWMTPAPQQPASGQHRHYSHTADRAPDFAFAFDIDGVLLRSSTPIPGAAESLQFLQRNSIPFILLTNGGGKTEAARTKYISDKLAVSLSESMIVQSHTPFAELVSPPQDQPATASSFYDSPPLKDKTILVCGGDYDGCQNVARSYGFENVVTPADIFTAHPDIWPFSQVFKQYYGEFARPIPRPINLNSPADSLKIDAVFVYADPRDWALEIQVILDVLLSRQGILGTYSDKNGDKSLPNHGYLQDGQPPLYFSNPDLLWAAAYHLPRLGQGGFREALEGVWKAVTKGADLKKHIIGKPHHETYEFAERKLLRHRETLFGHTHTNPEEGRLRTVYMVGDNPESDIAGANSYNSPEGIQWKSLLTRTGVYQDIEGQEPAHVPTAIVDNVKEAVKWALKDSAWPEPLR